MQKVKLLLTSIFLLSAVLSAGCQNTIEGFGKDMQHTGQEIQKSTQ